MIRAQIAGGLIVAILLAGCSVGQLSLGGSASQSPNVEMACRWILAEPNAPTCGMNFDGAPGATNGTVTPGGCPENFFTSRHWALEQTSLVITDEDNNAIAHLNFAWHQRPIHSRQAGGTEPSVLAAIVGTVMAEYQLYCFAQSGNAYRAALMLNLIGADGPWYDFFGKAPQRTPEFRETINEMGEAPVLVHGKKKLSQSGVILTYLARKSGKFLPQGEDEELEALRWIIFDNQKLNGFLGPYRFLKNFAPKPGDPAVMAFMKGRIDASLAIANKRLEKSRYLVGDKPTIADISLTGYLYYPAEEFGFDIAKDYPAIGAWLERMQVLPGWKHPYDLMPGYPFGTQGLMP